MELNETAANNIHCLYCGYIPRDETVEECIKNHKCVDRQLEQRNQYKEALQHISRHFGSAEQCRELAHNALNFPQSDQLSSHFNLLEYASENLTWEQIVWLYHHGMGNSFKIVEFKSNDTV